MVGERASKAMSPRLVGRCLLYEELASGGMAKVYLGRLLGSAGFSRLVAVKQLHSQFADDPHFVEMFLDEIRVVSRISHANVVQTLDVIDEDHAIYLVMEYVRGASLARMLSGVARQGTRLPPQVVAAILCNALYGLHAAHEAHGEDGMPLDIVHRDVSPQNIIVGIDGITRMIDFGIAKAAGRQQVTRDGVLKGKPAYIAPEQLKSDNVGRTADIYSASVVLWEALTARRLFTGDNFKILFEVLEREAPPPSSIVSDIQPEWDAVIEKGLARDPKDRFETAADMAKAIEEIGPLSSPAEVTSWLRRLAGDELDMRENLVASLEANKAFSGSFASVTPARTKSGDTPSFSHQAMVAFSSKNAPVDVHERATPPDPAPRAPRRIVAIALLALFAIAATMASLSVAFRKPPPATLLAPTSPAAVSYDILATPRSEATHSAVDATAETMDVLDATPSAPKLPRAVAPPARVQATTRQKQGPPVQHNLPSIPSSTDEGLEPPAKVKVDSTDCRVPYSLDGQGHRHYRPECLN
jgi:eukaryotic-like serine/threonine-protein kinase